MCVCVFKDDSFIVHKYFYKFINFQSVSKFKIGKDKKKTDNHFGQQVFKEQPRLYKKDYVKSSDFPTFILFSFTPLLCTSVTLSTFNVSNIPYHL